MRDRTRPPEPCSAIDPSQHSVVREDRRIDAIERLDDVQTSALSDDEATSFTGNAAFVSTATLRPFLVRAIAKHSAPMFFLQACGSTLVILQGSLGRSTSPSYRMPLVVMLAHEPERVEVLWSIAE
ncbi:MAG: hypothetical protein NT015_17505 [Alphaproteobacteria bacterium]|nr:hypothetical protein [Alphaproteobacteria bacterium]